MCIEPMNQMTIDEYVETAPEAEVRAVLSRLLLYSSYLGNDAPVFLYRSGDGKLYLQWEATGEAVFVAKGGEG